MIKTPAPPLLVLALALGANPGSAATPPQVGNPAPNFTLRTLDDRSIELGAHVGRGPFVLVVLRGWPGYQCPICSRQVHDFVAQAEKFMRHGAQVLMVYPGPADVLRAHAQEFLQDKSWPVHFLFVLDPDFAFTNAYGLRWDAKNETAYPSTFIIGPDGKIRFAHVSKSHGNRVGAKKVLEELK